ncbi:LuxR C-terminal-related transcriptional regulator [Streptomyces sp. NPDC001165]|uniref:helix-turn-helix transcriptional regulator n=1 Tax=Streptomyces sp. NPDC001165 TaxID=3364546 RepID=UPI003696714D
MRPDLVRIMGTVYKLALANADWQPARASQQHGWTEAELDEAVRALEKLRLFVPSQHTQSGWFAVSPETAEYQVMRAASTRALAALDETARAQEVIAALRADIPHIQESASHSQIQLVTGAANVAAALEDAAHGARRRVLSMHPGRPLPATAIAAGLERDRQVLSRGVEVRTIHIASSAAVPHMASYLLRLSDIGAQVRTLHTLPLRLIIVDHHLAFAPAPQAPATGQSDTSAVLLIKDPHVVRILELIYEHCWEQALQLRTPEETFRGDVDGTDQGWRPTSRHQELLRLMAAGSTDDAISRKLGVSERTVRRLVAELLAQLGAESRFQAGVNAVRSGWLVDAEPESGGGPLTSE